MKNQVNLIGRIGTDPILKEVTKGDKVLNISIAIDESYYDKEGIKQDACTWIKINAWNKNAELIAKYCKKGTQIAISGKLIVKSWIGKEGTKNYSTEVEVKEFTLLGGKNE